MKFAQLLWLLEVHTYRLLCFVGCQERNALTYLLDMLAGHGVIFSEWDC